MRVQKPGRRAAQGTGISAGSLIGLAVAGYGLIRAEAKIARRTIGEPTEQPPDPTGVYGRYLGPSLRLVMLGDSSSTGLGCETPAQTPGALLAGGIARELRRRVRLDVVGVVGGRSADLDTQVVRAMQTKIDFAVIMVGANDVTHRVAPGDAARDLGRAVQTLRAAGAIVVVGTCPDLGTVKPLLEPLRSVAAYRSRQLAAEQAVAVVENDAVAVTLGSLLAQEFSAHPHLWSADRFHPSPLGYRRVADVLLPSLLEQWGYPSATVPVSSSVQDANIAAAVAARDPGLSIETVEGEEGVAAVGPGRLARLVRRLPLVGRGDPDRREDDPAPEEDPTEQ